MNKKYFISLSIIMLSFQILLKAVPIVEQDNPFLDACRTKNIDMAQDIINSCDDQVKLDALLNQQNDENETPLHIAINSNAKEIALLLIDSGADINIQDQYYNTPLTMAILYNNIRIFNRLLEANVDINLQDDKEERAALHLACECMNLQMIRALLNAGANVNVVDTFGISPLAIIEGQSQHSDYVEIFDLLIEYGAGAEV